MIRIEFDIIMKDEVYDTIFTLMENIDSLNKGEEIGGWLLGDWNHEDNNLSLYLDRFVIPKQTVSKTEVDISPESMIDTVREVGFEEANRIKAHWHIHPFGKGTTNWSGTDESKIKDFMAPEKQREVFVFLLSSEDRIKARVEINAKVKSEFFGIEEIKRFSFDDLNVRKESQEQENQYLPFLKQRISEKIERPKYNYTTKTWGAKGWVDNTGKKEEKEDKETNYLVTSNKSKVLLTMTEEFSMFAEQYCDKESMLSEPEERKTKGSDKVVWTYDYHDKKNAKKAKKMLEEEIKGIEDLYYEDIDKMVESSKMDYGIQRDMRYEDDYLDDYYGRRGWGMR